ncbi:LPS export ABC transporter permease LptF [Pseudomonas syringae pv. tagetis]|uniref:Lipopolysaccharide export system permease protein LptF n=3 Tax=Pseudomonas syringae group TaxID=136849 RepID=A0A0N8QQT1_9PSED|nr:MULTISPECIES: LPS export ABC transporter permease LptF [Pseudomonas syringae group]KAA8695824.1 LPS export ABC transporter permease LptF [Pseudomonas caricapapayae]KPW54054.1 putative lipopolysaccharide ABC-type transport system, permease protein LptF [Pseudomonas caricapapayae]KPX49447.1 putative lipopolysaccharide ABC-type transport system, permease protein LptF [Pseudomonas syringae pv. helianthi]KPY88258.1 putative lipopolysaccharide ABC-type transport system, permease protein LptF [Pseu
MIVFRYLSREVLLTLSAVSAVLLVFIMSGRFIKYLAQAASGALDPGVLFMIMGFRLPGFLQVILPLGLFLGILMAYGRLYLESEMTVLAATGMSQQRLLAITMGPATLVGLLVAWLSFSLAPQGATQFSLLINQQDAMTEFDTLVPGRFQALRDGTRITYTKELSEDRSQLAGVFISEKRMSSDKSKDNGITVLVAEKGHQEVRPNGSRFLILENGYRYDGNPGAADYRVIKYDTYGAMLPKPEISEEITDREAIPTSELFGSNAPRSVAELQWRISLPLSVFIVTLMAIPLSRVNPRQGRYLKLLPAILLYMSYLAILISVRSSLEKGKLPLSLGMWWVHAIYLAIGLVLFYWEPLRLKMASRRSVTEVTRGQA